MYGLPDMIDMGLLEGQTWPTDEHRQVAQNLLIGRPGINNRDQLIEGVSVILKVPEDKITVVTLEELVEIYGFNVNLIS
jgi:hypothetical protein